MVTFKPRFLSKRPKLEAEIPLPNDETTPPVTKIYFVMPCFLSFLLLFVKIKKSSQVHGSLNAHRVPIQNTKGKFSSRQVL
ncbi:hypothetical protein LJCM5343_08510 [Lactobacillus paragasseri]|uniref:Transmembrane protein n=1 Tax=Lactobacillus paragasseri TaxID=2107999 RepID=A0ABQ0N459_9LACO|nr:hypothetical protein LpgJCM5343_02270 [Lactobacillus paragasseri]GBA82578.1 hypothetical protein LJCM1130_13050 [Lactobacillus paragasseri]GBA86382.1 hypothetical protein LJCM5343_08510 [Lactobacillus paragasseri]